MNDTIKLPKDFLDIMKSLLKNEYDDFLKSYDKDSTKAFILNKNKTDIDYLSKVFNYEFKKYDKTDLSYIYDIDTPGKSIFHEMGLFYIQEPSASIPAFLLDVQEGEKVLDLCAAPGGKSITMGIKLNSKGVLISNEINSKRCRILSENIERMGIDNAIVINEDTDKLKKIFIEDFDKIMVDAPCSGEGMFRKNEDARNEWSLENVKICKERQLHILDNASSMLKNDGYMVYSTCTFNKSENEEVVEEFLKTHPDFYLVKTVRHFPHQGIGEGHFAALLYKNAAGESTIKKKVKEVRGNSFKEYPSLKKFIDSNFSEEKKNDIYDKKLISFGDNLYLVPKDVINLDKILSKVKVLRLGLHLGTVEKNIFKPSYSLAKALKKDDFKNIINFSSDDIRIKKYISGETIEINDDLDNNTSYENGWILLLVDGNPLSFGKIVNGQIKNHYPKGLRKNLI